MNRFISAIILSAGRSSRMGAFKPLLEFGCKPVLCRQVELFRSVGIQDIRVVTGHRAEALSETIRQLGVREIRNTEWSRGMLTSIKAGISSLPPDCKGFFLLPVDIPLVRSHSLKRLLEAMDDEPAKIHYPVFQAMRGHPPLISSGLIPEIVRWHGNGGLRQYLTQKEPEAVDVVVADAAVLMDMDTPMDYDRLRQHHGRFEGVPTPDECVTLLREIYPVAEAVFRHCQCVAQLAGFLAQRLVDSGWDLNPDLVVAAGYLHDVARTQPRHAAAGAALVAGAGFARVADIIRVHMDIQPDPLGGIREHDVVYLADKMVDGHRIVGIRDRFRPRIQRHAQDSHILMKIGTRFKHAMDICRRMEAIVGTSMDAIVGEYLGETDGYLSVTAR